MRIQTLLPVIASVIPSACSEEEVIAVAPSSALEPSHRSHPDLYKKNAVWGSLTAGGQALSGATITVVRSNEVLEIDDSGTYALRLPEAEYGPPPPHELTFSRPGYLPQTHSVTVTESGVELNVDLQPETP